MESPHVVILPFPAQGHVKPMLNLAEILGQAGFNVTFVNTEHSHSLIDHTAFRRRCPTIHFHSVPDGLPPERKRSLVSFTDLFFSIPTYSKPIFKDLVSSLSQPPVTCIIADGIMSFAIDVAAELGIPAITFRTYSATCKWTYFHLQKLVEEGEIPVLEGNEEDMDKLISCIPGVENTMRRRDLPSICRLEPDNPILQFYIKQTAKMTKATALILNTFEELEAPMISHLSSIFPRVYAIGPLHSALKCTTTSVDSTPKNSSSLIQIDDSCMEWLDSQLPKSVLYVSFGSVVELSREQFLEFWYGLVNSGKPFLWAIRPDSIPDENELLHEIELGTANVMGRVVGWAPQEDILAHQAIGGFLTHNGWNSSLESICAGKPMICWPKIADQQVNRMCVSEMWKLGLDLKDSCDRSTVERMVRDLMEGRREDFVRSTVEMARLAKESVLDGGSSHNNIKKLVRDIKLLHSTKHAIQGK